MVLIKLRGRVDFVEGGGILIYFKYEICLRSCGFESCVDFVDKR